MFFQSGCRDETSVYRTPQCSWIQLNNTKFPAVSALESGIIILWGVSQKILHVKERVKRHSAADSSLWTQQQRTCVEQQISSTKNVSYDSAAEHSIEIPELDSNTISQPSRLPNKSRDNLHPAPLSSPLRIWTTLPPPNRMPPVLGGWQLDQEPERVGIYLSLPQASFSGGALQHGRERHVFAWHILIEPCRRRWSVVMRFCSAVVGTIAARLAKRLC